MSLEQRRQTEKSLEEADQLKAEIGRSLLAPSSPTEKFRLENELRNCEARIAGLEKQLGGRPKKDTPLKQANNYRKRLLKMVDFTYLRLVASDKRLSIDSAYIRLKILEKQEISFKDPDQISYATANTPNDQYRQEQVRLLERSSRAYDPAEAISKYPLAVIVGDPGAGKTTTLRFLTRQAALGKLKEQGLPDFPIFVPISRLNHSTDDDLTKFLPAFVEKEYGLDNAEAFLDQQFEAGKILLLLDGLDEAGATALEEHSNLYLHTLDLIKRFHRRYPQTPIVITCRKAGWSGGLEGFKVFEVLDFSWEDIEKFIEAWFCPDKAQEAARLKATRLIATLKDNVRMRFLAANPMLLSLICTVFERYMTLPERRAQLYQECVDWLLTLWDSSRALDRRSKFPSERKKDLLKELALYFQQQHHRYFEKSELLARIAAFLPQVNLDPAQAEPILKELMANHGLLEEEAVGWYGFSHLTLQEYFCARALRDENNLEPILDHLGDPWWEEVTLLYAGMGNAAPLLRALLDAKDDIFHTNLLLATRCLAGTPLIKGDGLRQKIRDQAFALAYDPNLVYKARREVASALVDTGDLDNRQQLLNHAILVPSKIDFALLNPLLPVLNSSQTLTVITLLSEPKLSDDVKGRIAVSLGRLGEKSVVGELVKLLSKPTLSDSVKGSIAASLVVLGEKSVVGELVKLLSEPKLSDDVKGGIAASLKQLIDSVEQVEQFAEATFASGGYRNAYGALQEAAQNLRVRLYRDDTTDPPRFYTEPLPD